VRASRAGTTPCGARDAPFPLFSRGYSASSARASVSATRRAWDLWEQLGAPYGAARARILVGLACRKLGDEDTAALEHEAARAAFVELRVQKSERPDLTEARIIISGGRGMREGKNFKVLEELAEGPL